MKTVVIAGAHRLAAAAAASYARMRKAGMPAGGVNSAYRDGALQRKLFLQRYKPQSSGGGQFNDVRWYQGVRYVRISAAGMVAIPGTSVHETGLALDMATSSAAHAWMLKNAAAHGWRRTIAAEPWHWEYTAKNDKHAVAKIAEDGFWGSGTTRRLQEILGTPVDGLVSGQSAAWRSQNPGLTTGWSWTSSKQPAGSLMIAALQRRLGVEADGLIGPTTIKALQRHLGTPADGRLDKKSRAIIALQNRLNKGTI